MTIRKELYDNGHENITLIGITTEDHKEGVRDWWDELLESAGHKGTATTTSFQLQS